MTKSKDSNTCSSLALDEEKIDSEMTSLKDWSLSSDSKKISREFKFKNFKEALEFTNKVGKVAESMNHHPDILLKYGSVKVHYWTHNADGLTEADFKAARKVNQVT